MTVVVPARDAAATLPRALAAIAAQRGAGEVEVVVVDDGSRDDTGRIAERAGARVARQEPSGPALARNAGAVLARAPVLAFTDADCFPAADWLVRGLAALAEADLVQGAVLPERPPGPLDRTVWVSGPHGLFETANLLVRRRLFIELGGFERGLVPGDGKELGEDVAFGWRARRAGARVAFAPDAVVRHAVFARDARGFVAERARLAAFPALAARIPELRSTVLWRRAFLTRRSASFDAALVGVAAARRRPAALALAAPYALTAARDARRLGGRAAAARVAADAVGLAALAAGSVRHGSLVL